MYQYFFPFFRGGIGCGIARGDILVDTNRIAMGLATCSLAWDWASRAVGLMAVRRAVNILVDFVVEEVVMKREGIGRA